MFNPFELLGMSEAELQAEKEKRDRVLKEDRKKIQQLHAMADFLVTIAPDEKSKKMVLIAKAVADLKDIVTYEFMQYADPAIALRTDDKVLDDLVEYLTIAKESFEKYVEENLKGGKQSENL